VPIGATDGHRHLIAHHLGGEHCQRLALRGIHLAGHDGATGLVLRQRELTQTATRSGAKETNIVGNLHQANGDRVEHTMHLHHGIAGSQCLELVDSGGDDMLLMAHDLRTKQRAWTNRAHMAGVTCLLSHPRHENHLLTGSYDEQLRLFDTRSMKRSLAELDLSGGIWRLKPHPAQPDLILAACMYTNFSVVQLDVAAPGLSLLGAYEEHKSICYGADWAPWRNKDDASLTMATCSFYDHTLCVSRVDINK